MHATPDLLEPVVGLPSDAIERVDRPPLARWLALPTVNPGDDDEDDDDEDSGNIDPDEDEGIGDDDEDDDEDDPLWARRRPRRLLRRNIARIRVPSRWRHTPRPRCRVAR